MTAGRLLLVVIASAAVSAAPPPPRQATTAADRRAAWAQHVRLRAESEFRGLAWEAIGPSLQGGRIEAIALSPADPATIYVGPGAGNVWKTTNNGMTWTPIFERESAFSIGDIAVAPSNANIVWVGSGEVQPRHSGPAFAGTGVFKSVDAGATWTHMGLDDTHHIGKVLIHPANPDIVYVAAMGHFRSPNAERGVFRTRDGGRMWDHVLFVSEQTGAIDLVMDPRDPRTLYAWAWQLPSGPESGLYRTTDAGATWQRVAGGLPPGPLGRAGLDIAATNPQVMYVFLDNAAPAPPGAPARPTTGGEVYRSDDRGVSWRRVNTDDLYGVFGAFGWKFCDIRVSPADENEVYILGNRMYRSADGGRTWTRIGEVIRRMHDTAGTAMHLDHHELVIDPRNPARLLLGNDGGVFQSFDRGQTWLHHNTLPIGQFYFVAIDDADPYRIYAGTQDNGALIGPSTWRLDAEPAANDAWRHIWLDRWTGGDAFVTLPDPTDPRFVYYEHQNGDMRRIDLSRNNPYSGGPATEVVRPRAGPGDPPVRFSWHMPFFISPHDPRTLYAAGNVVFKTTNRAASWRIISPDLGDAGADERARVPTGAVTTLSESPLAPGLLYAGTEGGRVWVTDDDGRNWRAIHAGLPGAWVTRVVASEHEVGTAYVSFSGYRDDDFRAYLFRSTDTGRTWTSIARGLPAEPVNVVREDPKSASVLYAGTDLGVYVSIDRGASWQALMANLPSTPVYDLAVHPGEDEIVAATHGRSLFLIDIRPIQDLTPAVRAQPVHVFPIRSVRLTWQVQREVPPQPPRAAARVHWWSGAAGGTIVEIADARGRRVRRIGVDAGRGVNGITWDLRDDSGRDVGAGTYDVVVSIAGVSASARLTVRPMEQ